MFHQVIFQVKDLPVSSCLHAAGIGKETNLSSSAIGCLNKMVAAWLKTFQVRFLEIKLILIHNRNFS